ncbi:hypothetical protein JQ604_10000 [Bradyrhizobium jicamae]|uniref:hypothetical protein n=1 Tax=Bradyrhizobium jicamae TaxID=280332 RepID=UPI001BA9A686|nr:hypothetical protein [Bradyrhizobium jicamae]MBR0752518.1 hypothetical protein [Bradyrhizobium jicamae]
MRILLAVIISALLAGPVCAQSQQPIPKYGEEDKEKTQAEKNRERDEQRAYQRSLNNIPAKGNTDPWGTVRSENPPQGAAKAPAKSAAKTAAPKATKSPGSASN